MPPDRNRELVARRYQNVRHCTRPKNEVHSILHAHLIPKCPHTALFNARRRARLAAQQLPDDERAAIDRLVRELDRLAEDLALLDRELAQDAIVDPAVNRLMTITGVNLAVAAGIVAAIGDLSGFSSPQKLVSYFGLNPRQPRLRVDIAAHQQIGRSHARAMLAEAAWAAAKRPLNCILFSCASAPGAAIRSPRWPWLASSHCALLAFVDEGRRLLPVDRPALVANKTRAMHFKPDICNKKATGVDRLCLQHQGAARPRDVDCR
ncbi:transposase [Bradyrhizobium sp. CW4]|uniref:transposase n=1 Tax=Bradyrhizobium sp. CW4 TaxID=2782687 RepID=UPI001FF93784|nr:transposase [Bradyrhizobium sp. CW4]MCK1412386.1 transposase [Bradyrhizobium sp. CW4]